MIVSGNHVAQFVSKRLRFALCPPYYAIGIERGGEIIGGMLLNCFEGADVHVTVAGQGWTRGFLHSAGDYVFEQLGCERATITTEQSHVEALALRLGGKREGVLRNHFGKGRDGIIVGILRDEYRYPPNVLESIPVFG